MPVYLLYDMIIEQITPLPKKKNLIPAKLKVSLITQRSNFEMNESFVILIKLFKDRNGSNRIGGKTEE